jgi:hypothetical protein
VPALPTRPGQFLTPTPEEGQERYGAPAKPPDEGLVDAPPMPADPTKKPPAQPDPATKKPPKR